ncbi:MAG: radical SAM protein [Thermoflexales bacterium]|nr:radical SAM protein [Thermoflexales bacterium]
MSDIVLPRVPSAPTSVDIAVTGRCNLACKYCFYADEMAALRDLPTERWLAFFEELGELAVRRVCLTGGEAFTRPDLFELIDGVVANRMRYHILSNGTLITEKVLAQFETGKRRLRLDYIQVSIDGSRAEIHDKSRPGSFERALRGLRLLTEAHFPVTVRVTVNRHNVDDMEAIARLLLDEIGLPGFGTNEAYPCGVVERGGRTVMLSPAQRRQAMDTLTELAARYDGRISASAGPLALAREFKMIEERLAAGETGMPGRGTLSSCGGVWSKIAVQHDGGLVPCHQLGTLRLGTIGVDDLRQVWLHHPLMQAARQRRAIPLQSLDTCRDCPYTGFCTGGCPGGAVFLSGELNARNPMDCYRVHKGEDPYYTLDE